MRTGPTDGSDPVGAGRTYETTTRVQRLIVAAYVIGCVALLLGIAVTS